MKIRIAANNEENFSMFVATCTYHKLKLTFWSGTKGVTPRETTAAVDPYLPVIFLKTDHYRTCIWHPCHHLTGAGHYENLEVQFSFHPSCHTASSRSDFHMSISRGTCHKWRCVLLVECLMTVLYLLKTVSFSQHLFVSSAEQPPPPPSSSSSSSSSSGPGAYAPDALQPIGLLCDPYPPVIFFRCSHFWWKVPPHPYNLRDPSSERWNCGRECWPVTLSKCRLPRFI